MSDQSILRITREIKQIQESADISIAVKYDESDIRRVDALIMGPPDTPYQFGFFEFAIKFGKDYPASPPSVRAATTNKGRCRFNPNIYASGKVCLSILGTWRGERGEQWSSAQGLESILISIQSLMSSNPYENEPGYETAESESDKANMAAYVSKIRHESLRIAVIEPLEASLGLLADGTSKPPNRTLSEDEDDWSSGDEGSNDESPFADLRKRRLLWYFESYLQIVDGADVETSCKRNFQRMPFESSGNTMDGHFDYPELRQRLVRIKDRIMEETENWQVEGREAQKQEVGIAVNLQRQYEQIVEDLKHHNNFTVDLELVDGNPFLWRLTYFGRPMTPLEGGIFKVKIHLSPRFPDEQPRVFLETPLSHIRVSKGRVLCYFPSRAYEMRHHVEAIVTALEEESPPYDPRTTVNPEASKMFWGSPEERKKYRRVLRREVEKSAEDEYA